VHNRRKHPRYDIAVPVLGRVMEPDGQVRGLRADTMNVSREGLAIAFLGGKGTIQRLRRILSETQSVKLEVEPPTLGSTIKATGSVRWYDVRPIAGARQYFVAGISLKRLEAEDKSKWEQFVQETARLATTEGPVA